MHKAFCTKNNMVYNAPSCIWLRIVNSEHDKKWSLIAQGPPKIHHKPFNFWHVYNESVKGVWRRNCGWKPEPQGLLRAIGLQNSPAISVLILLATLIENNTRNINTKLKAKLHLWKRKRHWLRNAGNTFLGVQIIFQIFPREACPCPLYM